MKMFKINLNLKTVSNSVIGLVLLCALVSTSFGQDSGGSEVVDGIVAYYGVVSSEIVGTHTPNHPEAEMHGGIPADKRAHHLVIALFEQGSFDRITNAEVSGTVAELGMAGQTKPLELFSINDSLTYGNYFNFTRGTKYQITVSVLVPGKKADVKFRFEYEHM